VASLADVFVTAAPDLSGFAEKLKAEAKKAADAAKTEVQVGFDVKKTELDRDLKAALAAVQKSAADVKIGFEVKQAELKTKMLAALAQAKTDSAAAKNQIKVDFDVQKDNLSKQMLTALANAKAVAAGDKEKILLRFDVKKEALETQLLTALANAKTAADRERVQVRFDIKKSQLNDQLRGALTEAKLKAEADKEKIKVEFDVRKEELNTQLSQALADAKNASETEKEKIRVQFDVRVQELRRDIRAATAEANRQSGEVRIGFNLKKLELKRELAVALKEAEAQARAANVEVKVKTDRRNIAQMGNAIRGLGNLGGFASQALSGASGIFSGFLGIVTGIGPIFSAAVSAVSTFGSVFSTVVGIAKGSMELFQAVSAQVKGLSSAASGAETAFGGLAASFGEAAASMGITLVVALVAAAIAGLVAALTSVVSLIGTFTITAIIAGAVAGILATAVTILAGALVVIPGILFGITGGLGVLLTAVYPIIQAFSAWMSLSKKSGQQDRQMADQQRQNARAIQDAEKAIVNAQRSALDAQKALTQARADAQRQLEDMRRGVIDQADSEEAARIRLIRAQQGFAPVKDLPVTDLGRREAALALSEAQHGLADTLAEGARKRTDLNSAEKKGVEGSDLVQSALERQRTAQEGLATAVESLAEAQRKAAEATDQGTAANQSYLDSLGALSPAGQIFLEVLQGIWGRFQDLSKLTQDALFPGLGPALQSITDALVPLTENGVLDPNGPLVLGAQAFGNAINSVALAFASLFQDKAFMEDLNTVIRISADLLGQFGVSGVQLFKDMITGTADLLVAIKPLTDAFLVGFEGSRDALTSFFKELSKPEVMAGLTAGMTAFFQILNGATTLLGPFIGKIAEFVGKLDLSNGGPILRFFDAFLQVLENLITGGVIEGFIVFMDAISTVMKILVDSGVIDQLSKSFGEVLIALAPVITSLVVQLAPLLPDLIRSIGELAVQFLLMLPTLVSLAPQFLELTRLIIEQLIPNLPFLIASLLIMAETFLIIAGAVYGLLTAFNWVVDWIIAGWTFVIATVMDLGGVLGRFFTETLPSWFRTSVEFIRGIWNALPEIIGNVWYLLQQQAISGVNALIRIINDLLGNVEGLAGKLGLTLTLGRIAYLGAPTAPSETQTNKSDTDRENKRLGRAFGGPIPGSSPHDKADNIPLWGTAGEFMQPVSAVRKYGHTMMEDIRTGRFPVMEKRAFGGLIRGYAQGGSIDEILAVANTSGIPHVATSTYRAGANDYHGQRKAVDFGDYKYGRTNNDIFADWWASKWGTKLLELIHSPSWFVKDGRQVSGPGYYGADTVAQHYNHVHVAANPGFSGGGGGGFDTGGGFFQRGLKSIAGHLVDAGVGTLSGMGPIGKIAGAAVKRAFDVIYPKYPDVGSEGGAADNTDMGSPDVAKIALFTANSMAANDKMILALMEAGVVESGMRNLSYGDRDSLGFLQQRASWGTAASRMNVAQSTARFINKAKGLPQGGTAGQLAQAVQVSAFPDRYDQAQGAALKWIAMFPWSQASAGLADGGPVEMPSDVKYKANRFDDGGMLHPGMLGINTGHRPEAVLNPDQTEAYRQGGGTTRLDDYSISKLARAMVYAMRSRPNELTMDGEKVTAKVSDRIVSSSLMAGG
jgi:hypothetical protein